MNIIPQTIMSTPRGDRFMDLYSRLLEDRIVLIDGQITDETASIVTAQLLYLESKDPDKDINMYINSPGGSVSAGMAIIDIMNLIKPDVVTIATGLAASMGSLILTCGAKGKRNILPHGEVMIHQPLGGAQGQATDIMITAAHIKRTRETIADMYVETTGQDIDTINKDIERDNWLTAQQALNYGLVDHVIERK